MKQKKFPKIVIGAIIYDDEGKIFLAKSHKWPDRWVVPGGHLDWGETLIDSVKREVKEETGLDVEDIKAVGIQESIFSQESHDPKHMIFLDYSCRAVNKDVKLNDELQEYIWIKPEDALEKLKTVLSTRVFIERFIKK